MSRLPDDSEFSHKLQQIVIDTRNYLDLIFRSNRTDAHILKCTRTCLIPRADISLCPLFKHPPLHITMTMANL